ncbi:MAG: 2-amino-4-hydroxy-6-hydroxymethyldihydropteridine diphosphokinase [Weeksellaceae bacterium]|nr:2-amino-4-hydroxy-6-hydroxymethyldihydropteridine diphosphokinase [Weeksellaceae bacterium]
MITAKIFPKNRFILQIIKLILLDMSKHSCVLLLGTNLGDRKKNLNIALSLIEIEIGIIQDKSKILETKAEDFESDHLFLNQTLTIGTPLSPIEILNRIKKIENQMGRVYLTDGERYQNRIIDIDILKINNINFQSARLLIPHPQIKSRKFVKKLLGLSV